MNWWEDIAFYFTCPKCGKWKVDFETFSAFALEENLKYIEGRVKEKTVDEVIVNFEEKCLKCTLDTSLVSQIAVRRYI